MAWVLRAARGEYVLTLDCDFQHLLPELRDILTAGEMGYDVVIGSRFSRHSVMLNYPFPKIVANRAFHTLARLFLRVGFRDVTNNLKLMRRSVVDEMVFCQPGFAINAETGLQPYLLGYRVHEVPISWINRTPGMGTSSFRLVKVGGGYGRVLVDLWRGRVLGRGPYAKLKRSHAARR
jgi:glycosyltransferase involved in cell wall biosynthesis